MITFVVSLLALIVGYVVYGRVVERIFAPDGRPTPAVSMADGVDYVVLPGWKIFMIQFLNIAGTGPIFGAIMGAKFGPSAYLWIVLGCIFAGAVHDYLSGMLSMRHGGAGLPELVGRYLGDRTKRVMLVFSVFLLLMVGAVFVYSPAIILGDLCGDSLTWVYLWCVIIFAYYFLATLLPIDKIIGRIYPLFAVAMLFMAVALFVVLVIKWPSLPELTDGLANMSPASGTIFPCLFITIACGAISGFHATQSPLMARCIKSERQGRPLFYGAMITEGVVALIWATVASYFFYGGAAAELGVPTTLPGARGGDHRVARLAWVSLAAHWPYWVSWRLLSRAATRRCAVPGSSSPSSCILSSTPSVSVFTSASRCSPSLWALLWFNIANEDGFNVIWSYFGWANQTLAVFTLWALTV